MPEDKNAIDFRAVADVRMDENYVSANTAALVKQSTPNRTFYAANYMDARKLEGPEISSSKPVFDPREFDELLSGKSV